jgi:hypothetical protein
LYDIDHVEEYVSLLSYLLIVVNISPTRGLDTVHGGHFVSPPSPEWYYKNQLNKILAVVARVVWDMYFRIQNRS